jgi:hypothetical protein
MTALQALTIEPEIDSRTGAFGVDYSDHSPWPASTTVVLGIASLMGVEPTSLCPLNAAVDPDALNQQVRDDWDRDAKLSFEFHGYRVTVGSHGHIEFAPLEDHDPPSREHVHTESR